MGVVARIARRESLQSGKHRQYCRVIPDIDISADSFAARDACNVIRRPLEYQMIPADSHRGLLRWLSARADSMHPSVSSH
jgi:hypothetical protein